jgi:hypothetical protein
MGPTRVCHRRQRYNQIFGARYAGFLAPDPGARSVVGAVTLTCWKTEPAPGMLYACVTATLRDVARMREYRQRGRPSIGNGPMSLQKKAWPDQT